MKRLLALAFVAMISLPLAANIAGRDGADPEAENRELATFPSFASRSVADFGGGLAQLTRWFDDHFGFRSTLIRWYGEERLFGLGVSPSAAVVKGADGWFFYADDNAIDDYASPAPMTPDAIANWRRAVLAARDWLRGRGVAYVFTIAPDKHTNATFTKAFGRAIHRPTVFPVPALAMKALYGEMASTVLAGSNPDPAKLLALGYEFRHPQLDDALRAELAR